MRAAEEGPGAPPGCPAQHAQAYWSMIGGPVKHLFSRTRCPRPRSDAGTSHGRLRHRMTVPIRWVLAHASCASTRQDGMRNGAKARPWQVHPSQAPSKSDSCGEATGGHAEPGSGSSGALRHFAEAKQHGRYGIDADLSSAPQPDPRARQKVPSRAKALEKKWRVTRVSQRTWVSRTDVRVTS